VPTIFELVKSEDDRKLAELIFRQDATGRPFAAPPGLSPERTAALRHGFMTMMADSAFLDDARSLGLDIEPMTETQRRYDAFYDTPKAVVDRVKAIIGRTVD
jgi:hypothetical protein